MSYRGIGGSPLGLSLAALLFPAVPGAAQARGFVAFNFGVPLVGPPVYYAPPVYYYPPPVVYTAPAPATVAPAQTCREYQSTTIIDGRPPRTYGTTCLQPDGSWRIVR